MADNLLYCTLDGHVPLEELLGWICNRNPEPAFIQNFGCNRSDFVLYFLNCLRQSTARASPPPKALLSSNKLGKKVSQSENIGNERQTTQYAQFYVSPEGVPCKRLETDSLGRKPSPHGTSKEKESKSFVETNSFVTSSPVQCSSISNGSPQLTPIHKRFQSYEMRSPSFSPSSPDHGSKNFHRSSGLCLGDFLIKDGKGNRNHHGKKRLSGSPPKSPADQSGITDDAHSSSSSKKKHRRRINPTKVNSESSAHQTGFDESKSFGALSQSLPLTSPFQEPTDFEPASASHSYSEERNLLKQERMKLQGDTFVPVTNSINLTPVSKFAVPKSRTVAELTKVTFQDELIKFSSIYCCVLDANLVPNLMTELYFVLQLLVIQDHHLENVHNALSTEVDIALEHLSLEDCEQSGEVPLGKIIDGDICLSPTKAFGPKEKLWRYLQVFSSVHNCVYFATKVLLNLNNVLECLDRITLKLLCENDRIRDFAPDLTQCLAALYTTASSGKSSSGRVTCTSVVNNNVAFQSETDNSSNFPGAQSFSSFRKQRDGFYDLIRIWEANHMSPGWCFTNALASRVRNLLQLCSDPTNYIHLARLFRLQLISTVLGEPYTCDEENPEDMQLQECLKGIDPDKLNRLRERLITPRKSAGPRPPPSFPGVQEFYRDFIISAYNSSFLQHLQDGLVSHLLELNETVFVASDMEDSDFSVDEVTKHEYLSTLSTMQLLAKFLGFIIFYPYHRSEGKLTENIIETEIALRSKVFPPIDVLSCLIEAHKNHRLIITVPWVVKFLGMMDTVSSALPVYRLTLRLLLHIYIGLCHKSKIKHSCEGGQEDMNMLSVHSMLLLRMCMGWLFDAPSVQDAVFYSWCFNLDESTLMDNPFWRMSAASELSLSALNSGPQASLISNTGPPVDALNLIDSQVLYTLCPFLLELRALLISAPATRSTPGNSVRHITPVSTSFSTSSPSSTSKQLELQLEENFFHNLPASVHRTVEFVEERVTSLCVKHICNVWLRSLKEQGIAKLRVKIESSWDNIDDVQEVLYKDAQVIVDEVSAELKQKCRSGINEVCLAKCRGALFSLLSEELLSPAVCEMCVAIATRTCVERVICWMQSHATLSMFGKDLQNEIDKALKHRDRSDIHVMAKTSHIAPGSNATWTHNDFAPSPFEVLQSIKLLVCSILDGQDTNREAIEDLLERIKLTVTERQDVVPAAERVLALLSVDLVVALACHSPSLLDSNLLCRMVDLWKLDALRPVEDGLARLVCPRNMLLLAQSHHPPRIVWEKLADVVVAVLKAQLVTPDLVENQCLAIMQQEWPQNILRCFSMCMNEVVRQYQKQRDVDYKFVLLLEWLAETMAQIEYFPDF